MSFGFGRRRFGRVVVMASLAVVLGASHSAPSFAQQPRFTSWFKPAEETLGSWEFVADKKDPLQVTIKRKGTDSPPDRKVFVLFPKPSSAYDIAMSKILGVFEEKNINAEFKLFNFRGNSKRGRQALKLAQEGDYELMFSMGSQSTAWLWDSYRGGSIPVVSVCSKDPVVLGQTASYDKGTGTNFAFTSLNMPVAVQMAYVLELKPKLKNLAILVNSKNVSAVETQAKPIAQSAKARGIRVLNVAVRNPKNAKRELAQLVKDSVRAMRKNDPTLNSSLFLITGSTTVFREIDTINRSADRVPVLSVVPEVVKAGDDSAVLSIGISFQSNAHLAAIYGASVLSGEAKAGDLKVGIVSPPDIAINFRKAREIALDVPFNFFESASVIYDYEGRMVRNNGKPVTASTAATVTR